MTSSESVFEETGGARTYWRGKRLNWVEDEGLLVSLLKYRHHRDRFQVDCTCGGDPLAASGEHHVACLVSQVKPNLISSKTTTGMQKPILDLDFPHEYVPSTKPGHGHLYLNVEIPTWRWAVLMVALRVAGVVELGFVAWSLRRGANFVRPRGVPKTPDEVIRAEAPPRYGWVFRVR